MTNPAETPVRPIRRETFIYLAGIPAEHVAGGAWAAVIVNTENGEEVARRRLTGTEPDASGGRLELRAAIEAVGSLTREERRDDVLASTTSLALVAGMQWQARIWERNGWSERSYAAMKHPDCWQTLRGLSLGRRGQWQRLHRADEMRDPEAFRIASEIVAGMRAVA